MASNNRAARLTKVLKIAKKYYKPFEAPRDRKVLEYLVYGCCLENSLHEEVDRVFGALTNDYFDWNEVRVSSLRELSDVMKALNDPEESATRVKRVLQSVFETHYSFDLEPMRKQNLGQTVKQLEKFNGTTSFTVAYVTQYGLGGHSIPINQGLLEVMRVVGVVTDSEASKGTVPGLERAVPKTKGIEQGSLLHQLGVELLRSPYGPNIRKLLLEIDKTCKDRLPKRSTKKAKEPAPAPPVKQAPPAAVSPPKVTGKPKKTVATKPASPPAPKKAEKEPAPAKKATPVKKAVVKKAKASAPVDKKHSNKKLTKKKPR